MGHPQKECLIVNHEELFMPLFERMPLLAMAEFLPQIRQLIDDGSHDDAMQLVIEKAVEAGYPSVGIRTTAELDRSFSGIPSMRMSRRRWRTCSPVARPS